MEDFNPFILKNYINPTYFCDRNSELTKLIQRFDNQRNTTLASNRRMGKTGLIYHLFYHLTERNQAIKCLYIDLYASQDLANFIRLLSKEIAIKLYKKPNIIVSSFKNMFKSMAPVVTFDTQSGMPQIEFNFRNEEEKRQSLEDIFHYLKNQDVKIVIAFDEFQQIATYPEQNVEALLRTLTQNLHNVNFIFSGSQKHLLIQMFASAQRPFYQTTDFMYLNTIPAPDYKAFISQKMLEGKKHIPEDTLDYILQFTRIHTYYVQSVCNRLYHYPKKELRKEYAQEVTAAILEENEDFYYSIRNLLPDYQWRLLQALAKEQGADKLNSKDFIHTHHLNTQGTVQRALAALLSKDMIFEEEGKYYVQDVFLSRWLERR